jgi:hypothetical protein
MEHAIIDKFSILSNMRHSTATLEESRVLQDFLRWRMKVARKSGNRETDNGLSVLSELLTWAEADADEIQSNYLAGSSTSATSM